MLKGVGAIAGDAALQYAARSRCDIEGGSEGGDAAAAKMLVKRPIAAYVEKVYEEGDFSQLGIGT